MTTALSILEALGSFAAGLAGRFGVFLLVGLALSAPAFALAFLWLWVERRRGRGELPVVARVAPNHTWLERRPRGELRVGVDEIAQRILPSATAVELPAKGMVVHRGDPIAVIRAGRRAVRIFAPVDGTVARVNRRVRRNPGLVKESPYGGGWLFELRPEDTRWRALPAGVGAEAFLLSERRRLARFVEEELGLAAADGGHLVAPAPALLGEEGWKKVVSAFLGAA
ncbi:MAG TPA: glycine cleavage system protein H [Anaeromyxobacter sp.]|nr:glycine cleavage system protein H [Anaeromyxobacter sp.]